MANSTIPEAPMPTAVMPNAGIDRELQQKLEAARNRNSGDHQSGLRRLWPFGKHHSDSAPSTPDAQLAVMATPPAVDQPKATAEEKRATIENIRRGVDLAGWVNELDEKSMSEGRPVNFRQEVIAGMRPLPATATLQERAERENTISEKVNQYYQLMARAIINSRYNHDDGVVQKLENVLSPSDVATLRTSLEEQVSPYNENNLPLELVNGQMKEFDGDIDFINSWKNELGIKDGETSPEQARKNIGEVIKWAASEALKQGIKPSFWMNVLIPMIAKKGILAATGLQGQPGAVIAGALVGTGMSGGKEWLSQMKQNRAEFLKNAEGDSPEAKAMKKNLKEKFRVLRMNDPKKVGRAAFKGAIRGAIGGLVGYEISDAIAGHGFFGIGGGDHSTATANAAGLSSAGENAAAPSTSADSAAVNHPFAQSGLPEGHDVVHSQTTPDPFTQSGLPEGHDAAHAGLDANRPSLDQNMPNPSHDTALGQHLGNAVPEHDQTLGQHLGNAAPEHDATLGQHLGNATTPEHDVTLGQHLGNAAPMPHIEPDPGLAQHLGTAGSVPEHDVTLGQHLGNAVPMEHDPALGQHLGNAAPDSPSHPDMGSHTTPETASGPTPPTETAPIPGTENVDPGVVQNIQENLGAIDKITVVPGSASYGAARQVLEQAMGHAASEPQVNELAKILAQGEILDPAGNVHHLDVSEWGIKGDMDSRFVPNGSSFAMNDTIRGAIIRIAAQGANGQ